MRLISGLIYSLALLPGLVYGQVPVVTSIAPSNGVVGATVTIQGTNFNTVASNNIVMFGAMKAQVVSAASDQVTAVVPAGVASTPITIAVNGLVASSLSPYLGTFPGSGNFSSASLISAGNLPVGTAPVDARIADMNGDGKPDLVVANSSNTISVYLFLNAPGVLEPGGFGAPVVFSAGPKPYRVTAADLNADGLVDLVVANLSGVSVFENRASGQNFGPESLNRVDFDVGQTNREVAVGDLDKDGRLDLAVASYGGNVWVLRNESTNRTISTDSFSLATSVSASSVSGIAIADIDGDKWPDLVMASETAGCVSIARNLTGNNFGAKVDFATGLNSRPMGVAVADLDSDGRLDVAAATYGNRALAVFRNITTKKEITTNTLAARISLDVGGLTHNLAIADFDGNGKADLVAISQSANKITVFKNVSTNQTLVAGSFAAGIDFLTGWNPIGFAVGDVNGDSRPDVVTANNFGNNLSLFRNEMTVGGPAIITTQPRSEIAVAGADHVLSVVALGLAPLSYQWSFKGVVISGATNSSLFIPDIQYTNEGEYSVRVSNAFGSADSSNAVISVDIIPVISPNGATSANDLDVTITTAHPDAKIYWTYDGTEPNTNSTLYVPEDGIRISGTGTLKAKGVIGTLVGRYTASADFSFSVADLQVSPAGGTSYNDVYVNVTSETKNARFDVIFKDQLGAAATNSVSPSFRLGTNGTLIAQGFKSGYAPSKAVTNVYNFIVANPVITPNGANTSSDVQVTLTSQTDGARIYWTINGSEPTSASTLYTGPFYLKSGGLMKVRAFKDGYTSSAIVGANFNLNVPGPIISPAGATSNNPVLVTITVPPNTTNGGSAEIRWTINGDEPTRTSFLYTNSFPLTTDGWLKAKYFRDGYADSATSSNLFELITSTPVITSTNQIFVGTNNSITITNATQQSIAYYTLNGSDPRNTNTSYSGALPLDINIRSNTMLKVAAYRPGFQWSEVVEQSYLVRLEAPELSPSSGYFPNGTLVTINHPRFDDVEIYYTSNGEDPTPNDTRYTVPFLIDEIFFPVPEMRVLKVRAFAPNTLPSVVVTGVGFQTNCIGVPRDMVAGVGSTIIVPVVANLATNQGVRSLQFRMEVIPQSGAPSLTKDIVGLNALLNDFVPLVGESSDGGPVSAWYSHYTNGPAAGVWYASIATNMLITNGFGFVANFSVPMPANAVEGQRYTVQVSQITGTADAQQRPVSLSPLPDRTITISNVHYLVGDCSPGRWYNAGEFGNGNLDNADVNMAFLASVGIRTPHLFSDAFNAMDVYPPDTTASVGGDGVLEFFDWSLLLKRSLRLETDNWERFWSVGGVLDHAGKTLSKAAARAPGVSSLPSISSRPGTVWFRPAQMGAQCLTNVVPGTTYDIPVFVKVLSGYSIAGLQFRAGITANGGPVSEAAPLSFIPAAGLPVPMTATYNHGIACGWASWPEPAFNPPMEGSNLLGCIRWKAPANAVAGQVFDLHFGFCSGASEDGQPAQIESFPARFPILAAGITTRDVISDEWKATFFGKVDSASASANIDADGDGLSNLAEYLAGTAPNDAGSNLRFEKACPNEGSKAVTLRWLSAPGKSYIIERSSALTGAGWTAITNIVGDGEFQTMSDSNATSQARFYRIRLQ